MSFGANFGEGLYSRQAWGLQLFGISVAPAFGSLLLALGFLRGASMEDLLERAAIREMNLAVQNGDINEANGRLLPTHRE